MSIAEFIRESVLRPRLKQAGALVVYDADKRYREQCFDLAADKVRVVDATESSIESREAALAALRDVGHPKSPVDGVLIYVPRRRPESDEEKQADPFALYAECGAVFPRDDGDEYLSLCLRARPDHATEIRQVFASSPAGPAFAVIDAIGGGVSWPQLRATLQVESGREILAALLAPSVAQVEALKQGEGWAQEARDFVRATLGLNLKTRGKTWSALAEESSPEIRARRKSFEFASLEVDRNRAGHYPQLDFVARSSRTQGESLSTVDQKNVINSVGVQLNVPLFAGGRVDALTGQAVANRARAQAELDAAVNEVLIEVRKQFMAVETGAGKIAAYQKAVDASVVAVEGTLRGMRGGIRSNVDVLNAERVMFVARRDLAQARYEYLLSLLQLRAAAGVLSEKDLQEVASLLLPPE